MNDATSWLTVRIPSDLAAALREHARRSERTVSGEARLALREHLSHELEQPRPPRDDEPIAA